MFGWGLGLVRKAVRAPHCEECTYWFVLVSSVWWVVFRLLIHLLTVYGPHSRPPHTRVATPHIL